MTSITPIPVDSTEGGVPFCYDCVGCGSHESTADGKAYFVELGFPTQAKRLFVCWTCARTDANPCFVRLDSQGSPLPEPKGTFA